MVRVYLKGVLGIKKFPENVVVLLAARGGFTGGKDAGGLLELLSVGFRMSLATQLIVLQFKA